MSIVSDTGPLIALAKSNHLETLKQIFGQVLIPPAVYRECLVSRKPEYHLLNAAFQDFIRVEQLQSFPPEVKVTVARLDVGEQQAIALAYERKLLLMVDEARGRAVARRLQLSLTGTVGVLLQFKKAGHVQEIIPLLRELCQKGYWLSDELMAIAATLAGEAGE